MASKDVSDASRDDASHLAQLLEAWLTTDVTALDDAALREVLTDSEAARNAVEALQARAMVEMQRRAHRDDLLDLPGSDSSIDTALPTGRREEFVVDEIAVYLHCTRVAASHRFATALTASAHPALGRAWASGAIDARKVQVIGDGLIDVDATIAEELAAAAADHAETRTAPQVRAWLARRVITADPGAAEQRRQRATAGRHVSLQPLPDGVAQLSAVMPALQARQVYDTLTSLAHQADSDDLRTLDQRRSDALFDLTTGRAEPPQVHLSITVPATSLIGDGPAELHGFGPVTVESIRALLDRSAVDGGVPGRGTPADMTPGPCPDLAVNPDATQHGRLTWRRLLVEPVNGSLIDLSEQQYRPSKHLDRSIRARDLTCRFPGCRRPATSPRSGVDLDHTVPWPHGPTAAENLACLCRHHHRLKHSPGWSVTLAADGTMAWTTPGGRRFTTHPWTYHDPVPSQAVNPPRAT